MNPEVLQSQLADGFAYAVRNAFTSAHVCYWHDRFRVMKVKHTHERHPVFAVYTYSHMLGGLTPREWLDLIKPILLYIKELEQCQPHQKPSPDPNATFF